MSNTTQLLLHGSARSEVMTTLLPVTILVMVVIISVMAARNVVEDTPNNVHININFRQSDDGQEQAQYYNEGSFLLSHRKKQKIDIDQNVLETSESCKKLHLYQKEHQKYGSSYNLNNMESQIFTNDKMKIGDPNYKLTAFFPIKHKIQLSYGRNSISQFLSKIFVNNQSQKQSDNSTNQEEFDKCLGCDKDLKEGHIIIKFGCGHSMHDRCLDEWLKQNKRTCPNCMKIFKVSNDRAYIRSNKSLDFQEFLKYGKDIQILQLVKQIQIQPTPFGQSAQNQQTIHQHNITESKFDNNNECGYIQFSCYNSDMLHRSGSVLVEKPIRDYENYQEINTPGKGR